MLVSFRAPRSHPAHKTYMCVYAVATPRARRRADADTRNVANGTCSHSTGQQVQYVGKERGQDAQVPRWCPAARWRLKTRREHCASHLHTVAQEWSPEWTGVRQSGRLGADSDERRGIPGTPRARPVHTGIPRRHLFFLCSSPHGPTPCASPQALEGLQVPGSCSPPGDTEFVFSSS